MQIIEAHGGATVAPPWFAPAIAAAIAAALAPILEFQAKVYNSSATLPEHSIVGVPIVVPPALIAAVPEPVVNGVTIVFPSTVQALQSMTDAEVRAFLTAYNLPVVGINNTQVKRKNALASFIGIRVRIVI